MLYFINLQNLAYTSALKTQPIILPKWGILFQYGNAEVINIFFYPTLGKLTYLDNL